MLGAKQNVNAFKILNLWHYLCLESVEMNGVCHRKIISANQKIKAKISMQKQKIATALAVTFAGLLSGCLELPVMIS